MVRGSLVCGSPYVRRRCRQHLDVHQLQDITMFRRRQGAFLSPSHEFLFGVMRIIPTRQFGYPEFVLLPDTLYADAPVARLCADP